MNPPPLATLHATRSCSLLLLAMTTTRRRGKESVEVVDNSYDGDEEMVC